MKIISNTVTQCGLMHGHNGQSPMGRPTERDGQPGQPPPPPGPMSL